MKNDINLNFYKTFYIVASLKSINDAANKMFISQPAVSKQIKTLENDLGVKLFVRTSKGISLTPEGKVLYSQIEKALYYIDLSDKQLQDYKSVLEGNLVIGCPSHITSFYLLNKIEKFIEKYPCITVRVDSSSTSELIEKLYRNDVDIIIDGLPVEVDDRFYKKELIEFETVFIKSKNYPYDFYSSESKFIMPPKRSSLRKRIDDSLSYNNKNIKIGLEVDTTDLTIKSVIKNLGIGFVIKNAIEEEINNNKIDIINVDFELPKLQIDLVYSKDYLSIVAERFLKECINEK